MDNMKNTKFIRKLPVPKDIKAQYPLSEEAAVKKEARDKEIEKVFKGESDKLVLVIGPCSADKPEPVLDYIHRLAEVQKEVDDKILIIPRIYTGKPRTTGAGYKGMLHQPDPEKKPDMLEGIIEVRQLHKDAIEQTGLTCADEMLYPENHRYLSDLLSYVAVGARSVENQPFLEAIRQFATDYGRENCVFIHVTLVPYLAASDELKSKPTQHSVKEMLSIGIQPDIIVCRTEHPLSEEIKRKISLFCNVGPDCVIENNNCDILYAVPMMLKEQKMDEVVLRKLGIDAPNQDLSDWEDMLFALRNPKQTVKIAMVGKYVELHDSYISVNEALKHGGIATRSAVDINWIDSESLEADGVDLDEVFKEVDGILVPGGFGSRGIEGKILACNYARTHKIPYLGICLGMQIAIIEFARNVLGLDGANSAEINPDTRYPVIDILPEKKNLTDLGGTLRLGKYPCVLNPESKSYELYGADEIWERHRHRYEVNNDYREALLSHGMIFAGTSPNNHIVEMIEIPDHPWFVAGQFHPEFKSRPNKPHPLFRGFVTAACEHLLNK